MARQATIDLKALIELGADKLAQIVLDESEENAAFRKRITAALAARSGPEAVANLIDKRLASLERSKSFIDWNKESAFRDDLQALVDMIDKELVPLAVDVAIDRLLRFVATHVRVFERIDDSSGRVQGVYYQAIAIIGETSKRLSADQANLLPEQVMKWLGETSHGYLIDVAEEVAENIPEPALKRWDVELEAIVMAAATVPNGKFNWRASQLEKVRQIIADALGDLDTLIALEGNKHPNSQDTIGIAVKLLGAGRAEEALIWIRKKKTGGLRYLRSEDMADGLEAIDALATSRVSMEAKILETLDDKNAAQILRWKCFEETLNDEILKEYVAALADFEEFDVLDKAFAHVMQSKDRHRALSFLIKWPRLDLASKLVVREYVAWDGGQYYFLPEVAAELEHDYPLAASILYRALLNDILARARAKAYGHAARHLAKLNRLSNRISSEVLPAGMDDHQAYCDALRKNHGRKTAFWSRVGVK